MAIDLCGLPGNPPSQEAGKRRGKARHRQLSYCGAALPVGVVSISPTTWASLAFPEEHGGFRRAHAYGSESRQRDDDVQNVVSQQMSDQELVFGWTGRRRFGDDI